MEGYEEAQPPEVVQNNASVENILHTRFVLKHIKATTDETHKPHPETHTFKYTCFGDGGQLCWGWRGSFRLPETTDLDAEVKVNDTDE